MKLMPIFALSDGDLVRRALREDARAGEELVLRYQRKAWAIVRAMGVRSDVMEDVVQESFLRAFGDLRRLERPEAFCGWFLTIVRNTARNNLRSSARAPYTFPSVDRHLEGDEPGEKADFEEYIWRKAAELPEGIRETVYLYYHEGESTRAVAKALGIDRSVVKNRLFRGRAILRDKLWREMEECLRDMLPSTREWKRKARRMALLALSAHFLSEAASAGGSITAFPIRPGPLASCPPEGVPPLHGVSTWILSGKKAAILALSLGTLLILGVTAHRLLSPGSGRESIPGQEGPPAVARKVTGGADGEVPKAETIAPSPPRSPAGKEEPSIFGRVVDPGGNPVAGASVHCIDLAGWCAAAREWNRIKTYSTAEDARNLEVLEESFRRAAKGLPRTETGADGSYIFRGLADGAYRILVAGRDHLPGAENFASCRAGRPARCDVVLIPGLSISGKVVDDGGRPVEGATVAGTLSSDACLRGSDIVERKVTDWEEGTLLLEDRGAKTDAAGAFRLTALQPAAYDLTAREGGKLFGLAFSVPAGSEGLTISLSRGSSVTGRVVTSGGAPGSGARVTLSPARSGEVHRIFETRRRDAPSSEGPSAVAGTEGEFRLDGLDEGLFHLTVTADGRPPIRKEIGIGPGDIDLGTFTLERPRALSGIVRGPDGAPVPGAAVWVLLPWRQATTATAQNFSVPAEPVARAVTGEDGRFALAGLPEGSIEVKAEAADLSPASAMVGRGILDVVLVLKAGLTIHGRVLEDASGAPISGAEVRIPAKDGKRAVTDEDGRFCLRGVPVDSASRRGCTLVEVCHPTFGLYRGWEYVPGHDAASPLEIHLPRMWRLAGRVIDGEGRPAEGVRVWVEASGQPKEDRDGSAFADSRGFSSGDGSFAIPVGSWARWLEGDVHVFVVASDSRSGSARVGPLDLPGTGEGWPDIEIVLQPGVSVEGAVTGEDGLPVAAAQVVVERTEAGVDPYSRGRRAPGKVAYTSRDGRFRVEGAEPGPSRIVARAVGFAPKRIEGFEVGRGAAPLEIVLERGRMTEGRVVDPGGRPVPLAEVVALPEEADGEEEESEFAARMELLTVSGIVSARTDIDGRYRLGPLPRGPFSAAARSEGYEAARIRSLEPGRPPPDIVLVRFAAVRGSVAASGTGEPVSSFRVTAVEKKRIRPSYPEDLIGSEGEIQFDDGEGRFLYDGLRPGEYVLFVKARGYGLHRQEMTLSAGEETEIRVSLEKGDRLDGVLLDEETGAPVAGAQVSWQTKGVPFIPRADSPLDATSGEDGSFSLRGLPAGEHSLFVGHPLYRSPGPAFRVPREAAAPLEVRMSPAGRLQGWVYGLDAFAGKTAERPFLLLARAGGAERGEGGKDEKGSAPRRINLWPDGRFQADCLEPGKYALQLEEARVEPAEKLDLGPEGIHRKYSSKEARETRDLGEVEIRPRETTSHRFNTGGDRP
jgi:RNA polymerase sigma factor (sigma-70 family)